MMDIVNRVHSSEIADDPPAFEGNWVPAEDVELLLIMAFNEGWCMHEHYAPKLTLEDAWNDSVVKNQAEGFSRTLRPDQRQRIEQIEKQMQAVSPSPERPKDEER